MSKMIAVCGSPDSGKTVTALKLAQAVYEETKKRVLFFSPDLLTPAMGYIFPNCSESDLYSVGCALDQTDICAEDVIRRIVTVRTMMNFGYLGFKAGENMHTYPRPTADKVTQLFSCMREIADYVIVDCVSDPADLISAMAGAEADAVTLIVSPDIKCMTYYASGEAQSAANGGRAVKVMNIKEKDMYLPTEEAAAHFKDVSVTLPYSWRLKKQTYTGTLSELLSDAKYKAGIVKLVKAVI